MITPDGVQLKKPRSLFAYFWKGLAALLPLVITISVLVLFFRLVEGRLDNALFFLPWELRENILFRIVAELAAFILVCLLLILWGMVVHRAVGRIFIKTTDTIIESIPGVNIIYRASKQAIGVLTMDKGPFLLKPVLAEWPSQEKWVIAFDTGLLNVRTAGEGFPTVEHHTVFIPTTPNPTSGFLAVLPRTKIIEMNVTTEEAVKMILTGGVAKAEHNGDTVGLPV